jgi:amino acid transporter
VAGFSSTDRFPEASTRIMTDVPNPALGTALVFVFLAYGGWSDMATISAEMRDAKHGMKRALILGMSIVTVLYVLVNWAFLRGLSHAGLAASEAPAADLMLAAFGRTGQLLIVGVVAITAITSMNAILIAGARTTYAAARDTAALAHLGRWHVARGTPSAAIVAIAVVSLALVGFGAYTRGGFATMVDYLSPVYGCFSRQRLRCSCCAAISGRDAAVRAGLSVRAARVHRSSVRALLEHGSCASARLGVLALVPWLFCGARAKGRRVGAITDFPAYSAHGVRLPFSY